MELVYDINKFGGINVSRGTTNNEVLSCENFDAVVDQNASSIYHGFITKFPKSTTSGNDIGSQISRGLFLFKRYEGLVYLQAFSDGTVRYLTGGAWTSILTGENGGRHFAFDSFSYLDKTFFSDGNLAVYKYHPSWTAAYGISDKDGIVTDLTGDLTFTESDATVTAVGGTFITELSPGDWIRKSSTEDWWEVLSVTNDDALELMTEYTGSTGAGGAGNSDVANKTSLRGRYIKVWRTDCLSER